MKASVLIKIVKKLFPIIFIGMLTGCTSLQRPSPLPPPPAMQAVEPEPTPEVLPEPPVLEKPEFYLHKVRWPGETISAIAKWYTGDRKNWEVIVRLMPEFDPKRMGIGDKIRIPPDILKTREPMPREFLRTSVPKKNVSSSSRAKPAIETDKIKAPDSPTKERSAADFDEIELFELQDTEASVSESDEIELFGPVDFSN